MCLFKGYVRTNDKKAREPFKNKTGAELRTIEQVESYTEYAGVLEDDVILIDVDDKAQSDILMRIVEDHDLLCRVYETNRGKHFLFKNHIVERCKTRTHLAVGIEADIKLGSRNSYSILKHDGKERQIIYDILPGEEYQEMPTYLLPIKGAPKFSDIRPGDGRNQRLFNYILTLQGEGLSVEQIRETIRLINQYVLQEPLEQDELEKILREESFTKQVFFEKNKLQHERFAKFLRSQYHVIRIEGQLHYYDNGIYVPDQRGLAAKMLKHIPNMTFNQRKEIFATLNLIADEAYISGENVNYIAFENGFFNLKTEQLEQFAPEKVITNKIPHPYDPNAQSDLVDHVLDKMACGDPSVRALLEEMAGYTLYKRNELRKAFILIGDKANGKSTYLDMVKTMLGEENTAALDLKELDKRFSTASLYGKLANIGDDIGDEFIPNPAMFKKIVSGDQIRAERKGKDEFFFSPYCKLLFSANDIPRIKDKSGAVLNRLVIIPFDATFSKNDPDYDPYIKYKLRDATEAFIKLALKGLARVLENSGFTTCERVQMELEEYEETNNPIVMFFKEIDRTNDILNQPTHDVFKKYNEFCLANGFTAMSRGEFSKQVNRKYKTTTKQKKIQGKKYQIFCEKE